MDGQQSPFHKPPTISPA